MRKSFISLPPLFLNFLFFFLFVCLLPLYLLGISLLYVIYLEIDHMILISMGPKIMDGADISIARFVAWVLSGFIEMPIPLE